MRREAGRVGHWHPGSAQATLQRAAEVAGTEKAGATSFGIPDAEPLHRWRVLFGLATTGHAEQLTRHVARVVERQLVTHSHRAEKLLRPSKQRPVVDWSVSRT